MVIDQTPQWGEITEIKSHKFDWYWLYTAKAKVPFGKLEHIEFTADQVQQFEQAGYEVCLWKETRRRCVLLKNIPASFQFDAQANVWRLCEVFSVEYRMPELEYETREHHTQTARMIPVEQVQPKTWIHHCKTYATEGCYEVLSVKVFPNGAVTVRVKMESGMGREFETGLSYRVGEMCEVVEERNTSK